MLSDESLGPLASPPAVPFIVDPASLKANVAEHPDRRASPRGSAHVRVKAAGGAERRSAREVAGWQHARLIDAAIEVIREGGGARFNATMVITRAGVSRKTFYELFTDTEDCLLAVLEHALHRLEGPVRLARETQDGWLEGLRAAVGALLAGLDEDRRLAAALLLDSLPRGPRIIEWRARLLERLAGEIAPPTPVDGALASPRLALATVGGCYELLANCALRGEPAQLTELQGVIMSMIVLPHDGRLAAREELARSTPELAIVPGAGEGAAAARSALHDLQTRLTYRTVRVLDAIAANPGSNNRQIAEAADISDQGQISKLLKRLLRIGLIENQRAGQAGGAPNRWRLTTKGASIQRAAGGARMLPLRR
ncbi:MAG TPA: TetR family transcriptional regulator [Solirubrobacteraceae bacterium]|nr:TetR family transcriptional regulator [Solirubrobacteraceae bacterium]